MEVHRTLGVSRSTLDDWLKLREQKGEVEPSRARRGPAPAIRDLEVFEEFAGRHRGCTLKEMALAWEKETGSKLSELPFFQALKRLGWTRKKRVSSTRNGTRNNVRPFWSS